MRSPGSLSWAGIFNTYFWIDPLKELAAVVMMQLLPGNDEKAVDLFRGFERLVYAGGSVLALESELRADETLTWKMLGDRKSVVEGKRGDLGGRRVIKKKRRAAWSDRE